MDILFVLIPLSVVLLLLVLGVFAWALHGGQFEDLDREAERILDVDQSGTATRNPESRRGIDEQKESVNA